MCGVRLTRPTGYVAVAGSGTTEDVAPCGSSSTAPLPDEPARHAGHRALRVAHVTAVVATPDRWYPRRVRARAVLSIAASALLAGSGCNQLLGLEPPARDDGGGGVDASAGDLDGDGVPDAIDNCPTVANRDQADEDGDAATNGGDACDPCPHVPAAVPGTPHADVDGDGVGDDCDPSLTERHCWRWFDGFGGDEEQVLGRYARDGGTWRVQGGSLIQDASHAGRARITVDGLERGAGWVATSGVLLTLPTTGMNGGPEPTRNAVAAIAASSVAGGVGACAGVVMRKPGQLEASVLLEAVAPSGDMAVAEATMTATSMEEGERFAANILLVPPPMMTVARARLLDDTPTAYTATAATSCSPGSAGVSTDFARASFAWLAVIETVGPSDDCPPRGPAP